MASSSQPQSVPHPIPTLSELNSRLDCGFKILTRIFVMYPKFVLRTEHVALFLITPFENFDAKHGALSLETNTISDLRRKLENVSPFCKHYMFHLDFQNRSLEKWKHVNRELPVAVPELTDERMRDEDWASISQSIYYEIRFKTNRSLQALDLPSANAEMNKCRKRDNQGKCVLTGRPQTEIFWLIPATWNNNVLHNNLTGNLEGSSMVLAAIRILGPIVNAHELGKTHKAWNMLCVDKVLHSYLVRGFCGFKFLDVGPPKGGGLVDVRLTFYWMPQLTGRFNRECNTRAEWIDIVNEFNAFVSEGCPPPPAYPKGLSPRPYSGHVISVETQQAELHNLKTAVGVHWACVTYTALCGGAGRPQFMTGKDQSYGELQPRDKEFSEQKAQVELEDRVSEMSWKKKYKSTSSDEGYKTGTSGGSGGSGGNRKRTG